MRTLQAESFSPLYAQLMNQLQADIHRGLYPVGSRIPPEHELEMNYGVSRVTVRRALQELTGEGLLERKQGKGTFVAMPKGKAVERKLRGFHDVCREAGRLPTAEVLSLREMPAEDRDREELNLPEESQVIECFRLLKADGEPVMLERNRFSMAYSYLAGADLQGGLYRCLQDYGVRPEKATWDIGQRNITAEEGRLLDAEEGNMLLAIRQVVYDQKGRPLHNSEQLIRGDRYTIRI